MKFKRILVMLIVIISLMTLCACNFGGGKNTNTPTTNDSVPILPDLISYSSETRYYNVQPVTYGDTDSQKALLNARIEERKQKPDLSVPLKIFVESEPSEIIDAMSRAALSYDKMDATVSYLAGGIEDAVDLDPIVDSGKWVDDDDWSFFDDWDYYEKLRDKADDSSNNKDSDNAMRQRRKLMRKIYEIGLSGDEFGRLIYEEMSYIIPLTEIKMYTAYNANFDEQDKVSYDEYVKSQLSYDALVYFKAYKDFADKDGGKSSVVQLYGYYYDFNKASYESTDDATFEKELKYSHQDTYTNEEWFDYLEIQRNHYIKAYRYSSEFYKKFYDSHFVFQGKIEDFDREVYEMGYALDTETRYTRQLQKGVDYGFAAQLKLSDHLYIYSKDNDAMRAYNQANTRYEQNKDGGAAKDRDEAEYLFNLEQLKVLDYILTKMSNNDLTNVLRYQIMTYSGDLIKDIQSEKKENVLDTVELADTEKYVPGSPEAKKLDEEIGRRAAIIEQIRNNHDNASPDSQLDSATDAPWDGIRGEVDTAINYDYSQCEYGKPRKEKLDNLLIKKVWQYDGGKEADSIDDVPSQFHVEAKEVYDTQHNISRFLNSHETVMRHMAGQVEVTTYAAPTKGGSPTTYNLADSPTGTYTCGIDGNMPSGKTPTSYVNTLESFSFKVNKTLAEGKVDEVKPNFADLEVRDGLAIADEIESDSQTNKDRKYTYTFVGWFIDVGLKHKLDVNEKVKYDLVYYPGYTVTITDVQK